MTVWVGVPDDPYIDDKTQLTTVDVQLREGRAVLASVSTVLEPDEDLLQGVLPGMPRLAIYNPLLAYETGGDFMRAFWSAALELEPHALADHVTVAGLLQLEGVGARRPDPEGSRRRGALGRHRRCFARRMAFIRSLPCRTNIRPGRAMPSSAFSKPAPSSGSRWWPSSP